MGAKYLIDSNAIIDYLTGKLPASGMTFMNDVINDIPNVSIISKIEVLGFKTTPYAYHVLTNFFYDANIFDLTEEVVDATIEMRRSYKIKLPDTIIAATALVNKFELITRNASDFKNIPTLTTIDPHLLE